MTFQKINLCASTRIAMDIFNVFRNSTLKQEECFDYDFKMNDIDICAISRTLQGDYNEIRVHNVVTGGVYIPEEYRLVQILIKGHQDYPCKTIMSIKVKRVCVDGDWFAWKMDSIEIKITHENGLGKQRVIKIDKNGNFS